MPSIDERAAGVLEQTNELAGRVESWAEFSHAVFNPQDGLAARAFPSLRERREFTMTPQYAEIYRILGDLMRKSGGVSEARTQLSHEQCVRMRRRIAQADGQERSP
jgi:hypothetical protein